MIGYNTYCMLQTAVDPIMSANFAFLFLLELPHDKFNETACASSEHSDQLGYPPSLIKVFVVCMEQTWVLSYP